MFTLVCSPHPTHRSLHLTLTQHRSTPAPPTIGVHQHETCVLDEQCLIQRMGLAAIGGFGVVMVGQDWCCPCTHSPISTPRCPLVPRWDMDDLMATLGVLAPMRPQASSPPSGPARLNWLGRQCESRSVFFLARLHWMSLTWGRACDVCA